MIVAVSSIGVNLSSQVEPRFGRCPNFLIIDTDTMDFKVVSNEARNTAHGAGVGAARIVVSQGVNAVLTGNVGPNAFNALSASKIQIFTGISGTINESLNRLRNGELESTLSPTVDGHFGRGRRRRI